MDHVVTIQDLTDDDIVSVLDRARELLPVAHGDERSDVLAGKILATCFFEPSTRTRLSFETAMHRLAGDVIGFADPSATSHLKGETLADAVRMVAGYADAIVLRHPQEGSAQLAAEISEVPVINGGDGAGQHPTQTLLDLFTIREEVGKLEGLTVGLLGDLRYGRTVHSLAAALARYDTTMHFIAPKSLAMPRRVTTELPDGWSAHAALDGILPELDLLYVTRIQKERFPDPEDYARVAGAYTISAEILRDAKPTLRILHPLPRIDEIATDVDGTDHAAYFRQAFNGVPVRMALLEMLLGSD
ncbi:MAG: aspartate carbamoyltransferase [Candidatus Thermoplasmatota archaeon]|nr:aspartate carbamoyltransferase [Candidatus Thermoplasmatota archaeon]